MTAETIKPGYYWAKFESETRYALFHTIDGNVFLKFMAVIPLPHYADEFTDIAPALPPDQWPDENIMIGESFRISNNKEEHRGFQNGFCACYKLFTGKHLQ